MIRSALLATAALAVLALGSAASTAQASDVLLDPRSCLTEPADATLNLGPGVPGVEVRNFSTWEPYVMGDPCDTFMADINVPFNSSGGLGYASKFSIYAHHGLYGKLVTSDPNEIPLDRGECLGEYHLGYSVYRRNPDRQTFAEVGWRSLVSKWVERSLIAPAHCVLVPTQYDGELPAEFIPPTARTATYRVIAYAGYLGTGWWDSWWPVEVGARHARVA
jgi:hypothetical protein